MLHGVLTSVSLWKQIGLCCVLQLAEASSDPYLDIWGTCTGGNLRCFTHLPQVRHMPSYLIYYLLLWAVCLASSSAQGTHSLSI
jgi:hypothetical protein